jgi:hypothetical protein
LLIRERYQYLNLCRIGIANNRGISTLFRVGMDIVEKGISTSVCVGLNIVDDEGIGTLICV